MSNRFKLQTERLVLNPLDLSDAAFIQRLVNTEGWKKYIGDRNVDCLQAAEDYIQRMNRMENCQSWTTRLIDTKQTIGVITYIKRDYHDYHDLGFAFLPEFQNQGYAYEAANSVLNHFKNRSEFEHMLATTIPENQNSIRLLEKLGFKFEKKIEVENEELLLFKI